MKGESMTTFIFFYSIIGILFDAIIMMPILKRIHQFDIIPLHSIILMGILTPIIYPLIIIVSTISAIKYYIHQQ
jgi:hypothetical protein